MQHRGSIHAVSERAMSAVLEAPCGLASSQRVLFLRHLAKVKYELLHFDGSLIQNFFLFSGATKHGPKVRNGTNCLSCFWCDVNVCKKCFDDYLKTQG